MIVTLNWEQYQIRDTFLKARVVFRLTMKKYELKNICILSVVSGKTNLSKLPKVIRLRKKNVIPHYLKSPDSYLMLH